MEQIAFHPLSLTPDDHAAPQGSLALCAGVSLHDGALRPEGIGGTVLNVSTRVDGRVARLLYVHRADTYTNYILALPADDNGTGGFLYCAHADGTPPVPISGTEGLATATSATAVGNTLVVIAADGTVHYILYSRQQYAYLGMQPPFVPFQFTLTCNGIASGDAYAYTCHDGVFQDGTSTPLLTWNIKEEARQGITEAATAAVNKMYHEQAEKGCFCYPFLVRCCYRLFDGTSLVMHSPPVLMYTKLQHPAEAAVLNATARENADGTATVSFSYKDSDCRIAPVLFPATLQWRCLDTALYDELRGKWADIVTAVEVYVTPQLARHKDAELAKALVYRWGMSYNVGGNVNYSLVNGTFSDYLNTPTGSWPGFGSNRNHPVAVQLPEEELPAYLSRIAQQAAFFRLAAVQLDTKKTWSAGFEDVPFQPSVLLNITAQPQLADDYKTHHTLTARSAYVYNRRLHLVGLGERLFRGFTPEVMAPWIKAAKVNNQDRIPEKVTAVAVAVNTGTDTVYAQNMLDEPYALFPDAAAWTPWFYPDARAREMHFLTHSIASMHHAVPLQALDSLNGAAAALGSALSLSGTPAFGTSADGGRPSVPMLNKIYTSALNNPFHFPIGGINTVGIAEITGLGTATLALSQADQIGTLPLIAFTAEGIYALAVSESGTYSAVHTFSRAVCANPAAVTQLEQSIVFPTDRALNKIVGSDVQTFSRSLDGPWFNVAAHMPQLVQALPDTDRCLVSLAAAPASLYRSSRILYDSVRHRIILVPGTGGSAAGQVLYLAYSIDNQSFYTFADKATVTVLNSYPYPLLQYTDGTVRQLDTPYPYGCNDTAATTAVAVTRTLTFSQLPSAVTSLVQSHTANTPPQLFLYGSNDDRRWQYIGTTSSYRVPYLPAHPFRFFRVGLVLHLKPDEQYMGIQLGVTVKYGKV